MPFLILVLFICVPIAEIAVFIQVGEAIGLVPTLLTVILTAIIGTYLLQRQGLSAFQRTQTALAEGRVPVDSAVDGMCLLVAGAFLLTPGIITDAVGFLLFVPPLRRALASMAFRRFTKNMKIHVNVDGQAGTGPTSGPSGPTPDGNGPIIDGEYEHVEPKDRTGKGARPSGSSPWLSSPKGK